MLHRILTTAGCAVLLLLLALPGMAAADNAAGDSFTVSGVHEDVTAASALAARDQALAQGQQQAFNILMSRLVPADMPPPVTPDQLTDLIASFEVANERTSSVRYVVDYTFHFNAGAVQRLLQQVGGRLVPRSGPVVVLPVFETGDQSVLWDDPNPWRDAWADHSDSQGAIPVVVPVGDLADVAQIDVPKALKGDAAAIQAMSARYHNDDVVVAKARLQDKPTRLAITATRYSAAGPQDVSLTVTANPGETQTDLMTRAVGATLAKLAQSWATASAAENNHAATLDAEVPVNSLADWTALRHRLSQISAVRSVDLVSFSADRIRVAIRYVGSQDRLRAALAAAGLDLEGSDPDWLLTMGAPGSPPMASSGGSDEGPSAAPNPATEMPPPDQDDQGGDIGGLRRANEPPPP